MQEQPDIKEPPPVETSGAEKSQTVASETSDPSGDKTAKATVPAPAGLSRAEAAKAARQEAAAAKAAEENAATEVAAMTTTSNAAAEAAMTTTPNAPTEAATMTKAPDASAADMEDREGTTSPDTLVQQTAETSVQEKPCRHEYVKIYQRKLKELDRRLVATRAYLPVGFKLGDFSHLGEGSYCFCTKCRARLYPRRTQADKLAARVALAQGKADAAAAAELAEETAVQEAAQESAIADIHVEELELEAVDVQDIEAEGVKLSDEDETSSLNDEDI